MLFLVNMVSWPSIEIKLQVEDVRFKNALDFDIFLNQDLQILEEQEAGYIVVLILDNVINDDVDCPNLIVLKSNINTIGVEEARTIFLLKLVLVDDREFFIEVLSVVRAQESCHHLTIKCKESH